MGEVNRQQVTQQEVDIFGVSMAIVARVGDKTFSASVSPVDFKHFKSTLYRDKLHAEVVKRIETELAAPRSDTPQKDQS